MLDRIIARLIDIDRNRTNDRGNLVQHSQFIGGDRYVFDVKVCTPALGWEQWDTEQDASYYGIWVSREERRIVCFAEGDLSIVTCPDDEHFAAELTSMEEFHGSPPPAFVVLDLENYTRTDVFADRLSAKDLATA